MKRGRKRKYFTPFTGKQPTKDEMASYLKTYCPIKLSVLQVKLNISYIKLSRALTRATFYYPQISEDDNNIIYWNAS